jgi:hypothetical protein
MASLYTQNVFFPLSEGEKGWIIQVQGSRDLGTGEHLRVTTKSHRDEIKAVLETLRGSPEGARRRDDHYLLAQFPREKNFSGISHGLAFAITEFQLAYARVPPRYTSHQRVEAMAQSQLLIVATGEIDEAGNVRAVNQDEMASKIRAILMPAVWPSRTVPEARQKVFVFPKGNDCDDIAEELCRLREAGWTPRPVESIDELVDLYDPERLDVSETRPPRWTPVAGIMFGIAIAATLGLLPLFSKGVEESEMTAAPTDADSLVSTPAAPDRPQASSLTEPSSVLPVQQTSSPLFAYSGQLTVEVVPIRGDGSLGPVLAEAHPFVNDDRVGLLLTHSASPRKALAVIRSGTDGLIRAQVVLEPGRAVARKSFDIQDLIGAKGGPVVYITDCESDCGAEIASFQAWVEKSGGLGVPRRTGIGNGSAPLVLNANLQLWSPP